jgi:glycerol uptake facilitator protein
MQGIGGLYMAAFIGEFLGVFILVFIGISTVAVSVLFNAPSGILQIGLIWGIGVTLAIYATRHLSCAHLNPAVSVGMAIAGRMKLRKLPIYVLAQFMGGIAAGAIVLMVFHGFIIVFESTNNIVRGTADSIRTAMIFGDYFPNPGLGDVRFTVSTSTAFFSEALGTFLLISMIFLLTEGCNLGKPNEGVSPIFIGATLTVLICIFSPLTQASFNPARDFGPKLIAYFAGWNAIAIPGPNGGVFVVYILAPVFGAAFSGLFWRYALVPLMDRKTSELGCKCNSLLIPEQVTVDSNKFDQD